MGLRHEGRVILVTGASSGIGRAAVARLAREGAQVIAAARRLAEGEAAVEAAQAVAEGDGGARFIAVDIADAESIDTLFARIEAEVGRLDGAFNNAGVEAQAALLPETPVETFDRVFATNVRGTWLCLRHEMRIMRAQGRGAIVNTSSIAGLIGYPHASVYTASKHAIVGMTKSAGLDFAAEGVRVNCLAPGATRSEMSARWAERIPGGEAALAQRIPNRRVAEPDEQAAVASFLLSDEAAYMTGATVVVDGGVSVG